MYDQTVAELEDDLKEANMLLRLFKAYILAQKSRSIEVSDQNVQRVTGSEDVEVYHDDSGGSTIIKLLKPK